MGLGEPVRLYAAGSSVSKSVKYRKSRNDLRRNVALIERRRFEVAFGRPVTRILNVPELGSIMLPWLPSTQLVDPAAGSSSIVYCAGEPATLRHLRGSVPFCSALGHTWLTGLFSLPFGAATLVHFVQ